MTDHLSPNGDNKIIPTTSLNSLARACQTEREKAARRKFVRQLASHLSMVFYINPQEQMLVITLCGGGSARNNLEALSRWIDTKLTDENANEKAEFWEGELVSVLSEIVNPL